LVRRVTEAHQQLQEKRGMAAAVIMGSKRKLRNPVVQGLQAEIPSEIPSDKDSIISGILCRQVIG